MAVAGEDEAKPRIKLQDPMCEWQARRMGIGPECQAQPCGRQLRRP